HRGLLWTEVTTEGRAAHGARPWLGTSAVYMMNEVITAIRGLEKELTRKKHTLVSSPSINIGTISGGTRINVVPDRCVIMIDRRVIPTETAEEAKSEITKVIEGLRSIDEDFKFSLRVINETPPFQISPNEPIVDSLRRAVMKVLGHELTVGGKDETTDAHYLVRTGIPTALFGPGIVERSHTVDEYAEIEKIVQATKIYALVACEILGEH
ncbi:MAG TPA: M20/M25/M40 family metallo-hydrolase, partial [Candidatus Hodarchaeales archaeon]|nr:M20/M25/M40 family metallo-hydrolase [Candidatus Hodarchaeales archaeon]